MILPLTATAADVAGLIAALRDLPSRDARTVLLSTTQAAAVLGVSVRTLQRRARNGEVRRLSLAGHPVYRLTDLGSAIA